MIVDSWYNGYSPKERDTKFKVLKKLIKSGELESAKGPCDLCNDPNVAVEHHDEDYGLPYLWTKPALLCLCSSCHRYRLHKRFTNPKNWFAFIAHVRRGGYASDLKDKLIKKEVKLYQKAADEGTQFELENLRPYNHRIGGEWFANIRMDIESLKDPNARLRGQKMQAVKKIIYIDMDNVLVDFKTGIAKLSKDIQSEYDGHLDDVPGIFGLMEPMEGAVNAFNHLSQLNKYDVYILSTAPWDNSTAWSDKVEWVKKHLGINGHKRLILSHHKNLNAGDYLIDDRTKNGADKFTGEHIHFGQNKFSTWKQVLDYLI